MQLDFKKGNGLIPAIIQHADTMQVLMLGYMNKEALEKTRNESVVTFFSRSKERLWTKGETSGNYLHVKEIAEDCDQDTLLIKVLPDGPTCHKGTESCFGETGDKGFIYALESKIESRLKGDDPESYTRALTAQGINKVAQKVGEEAVEFIIEAKDNNDKLFLNEGADLIFHFLLLLQAKGYRLKDIEKVLGSRAQ